MKIALLSSSAECAALLRQLTAAAGHDYAIYAGPEGFAAAATEGVDLLVTDLDALESHAAQAEASLHTLRCHATQHGEPPSVLLLASPAHTKLVRVLRAAGADDYLLKPIRRHELAWRIALLAGDRQPDATPASATEADGFVFDLGRLRVTHPARPALNAVLTQKECELALLLLQHLGRPLSRTFLQERIWGAEPEIPTRTIDTHVSRVRTKLGLKPEHGYKLGTVYGYGYQLERLDRPGQAVSGAESSPE